MSLCPTSLALDRSGDNISDICRWVIEQGRVVRIYNSGAEKSGLVYHQVCMKKEDGKQEKENIPLLTDIKVVWVNVMEVPEVLGEGRWSKLLQESGCKICTCHFAEKIAQGGLLVGAPPIHGFKISRCL